MEDILNALDSAVETSTYNTRKRISGQIIGGEILSDEAEVVEEEENYTDDDEASIEIRDTKNKNFLLVDNSWPMNSGIWKFIGSCSINLILPFINGLMLGFGELFAHELSWRYNWFNKNNFGGFKI